MGLFLDVLKGGKTIRPPLWLMRQAGRYLPEYRATREKAGSFLDLVYHPDLAAEVTMQPIRRFGFDAAILFSDILVVPHALGVDVRFETGEGPRLDPIRSVGDIQSLIPHLDRFKLIDQTVSKIKSQLHDEKLDVPLIGFAGAPWTVACYMIDGHGQDRSFPVAHQLASHDPEFFKLLIDRIIQMTIDYLVGQIKAGADVIQLFDSWAGLVPLPHVANWIIAPTKAIIDGVRAVYPTVPVIGFPRGLHQAYRSAYIKGTGVTAFGIGEDVDLNDLWSSIPEPCVTQGNLAPHLLVQGGPALDRAIDTILAATQGRPHIFNLGHGITPDTPIDHVNQLVKRVRGL